MLTGPNLSLTGVSLKTSCCATGAVARVDELATAFPHRNAETMLVFVSMWDDPEQDEECIAGTRAWYRHLEPFTGGYYDNIDFDGNEVAGNYGPAYERLASVKGQFSSIRATCSGRTATSSRPERGLSSRSRVPVRRRREPTKE